MDILGASWRESTKRQYNVYVNKWTKFCDTRHIVWTHTKVGVLLDFFNVLYYEEKAGYSVLNTARSALASFLILDDCNYTVGTHPLICRYLKGVFNLRPPRPRYSFTWDVHKVLKFLRKRGPAHKLTLSDLTHKLSMLLALVTAQRLQTLHFLSLDGIKIRKGSMDISIQDLLKQSRPGNVGKNFQLQTYTTDRRLCVVHYTKEYIRRTQTLRGNERQLFITCNKPHRRASKQSIARWIKVVMKSAGIDTSVFKPHSTRAASTSLAMRRDVPISDILKQAGWQNESTFRDFYLKPPQTETVTFDRAVLECQGPQTHK